MPSWLHFRRIAVLVFDLARPGDAQGVSPFEYVGAVALVALLGIGSLRLGRHGLRRS